MEQQLTSVKIYLLSQIISNVKEGEAEGQILNPAAIQ